MPEANLRAWLARCPIPERLGRKMGPRLWLSASDAFYYLLVRDLTDLGVGVRSAMLMAETLVPADDLPAHRYLIITRSGEKTTLASVDEPRLQVGRTVAVMPIRDLAKDVLDRAAVVHAEAVSR